MTTVYIPMSMDTAIWAFLDRRTALESGFASKDRVLTGFMKREEAIAAAAGDYPRPFALMHITFDSNVHEALAWKGLLKGHEGRWNISAPGCAELANTCVMTMEIVPGSYQQSEAQKVDVFDNGLSGPTGSGC